MGEQFHTRPATIEDLESLAELFDLYRVFYEQASDREQARQFLWERFEHQESVLFITLHSETGEAAGFIQLYPSFSSVSMRRIWILNDLYVKAGFRANGVAGKLLEAAKTYAQLTKAKRIELTTAVTNNQAKRLYEKHGYVCDKIFDSYLLTI
ncbi:MAG: GNAT family N-acetyltransferase [Gorillibacterium sp.]|nr:GNAT family N-acetyltransferase [Gorillibacterium sp.]